jgi:hypothetical protein
MGQAIILGPSKSGSSHSKSSNKRTKPSHFIILTHFSLGPSKSGSSHSKSSNKRTLKPTSHHLPYFFPLGPFKKAVQAHSNLQISGPSQAKPFHHLP